MLGPYLQKLVVGGTEYGNQTLTRFYGLHVGVLPTLLVLCLAAHIALFRKHGITAPRNAQGMGRFWPEQVFMDTVASVAVLGVLVFLVVAEGGANLDAPADPSSANYPARPEWYFLSLFQMLKYFPGEHEVVGSIVIPTAIMVVLLLLPLLDRVLPGRLAHFLACAFVFALVGGAGYLTVEASRDGRREHEVPRRPHGGRRGPQTGARAGRGREGGHPPRWRGVRPAPRPALSTAGPSWSGSAWAATTTTARATGRRRSAAPT